MPEFDIVLTRTTTETLTFAMKAKDEDTARERIEAFLENETDTVKVAKKFKADTEIDPEDWEVEIDEA